MRVVEAVLSRFRLDIRMDSEPLIRAMALCYLADWKAALDLGRQITTSKWVKVSWGPYAPEIVEAMIILHSNKINVANHDAYHFKNHTLDAQEAEIIDRIRDKYLKKDINEVLKLVKSTYPILYNNSDSGLDLVALASVYKEDFAGDIIKHQTREKDTVSLG